MNPICPKLMIPELPAKVQIPTTRTTRISISTTVLCSVPERDRLKGLLNLGLVDTFRRFDQPEKAFSWWDYRMMGFRRNHGLRIDLILASTALAAHCSGATIDVAPRKLEKPSDHAPVVAVL